MSKLRIGERLTYEDLLEAGVENNEADDFRHRFPDGVTVTPDFAALCDQSLICVDALALALLDGPDLVVFREMVAMSEAEMRASKARSETEYDAAMLRLWEEKYGRRYRVLHTEKNAAISKVAKPIVAAFTEKARPLWSAFSADSEPLRTHHNGWDAATVKAHHGRLVAALTAVLTGDVETTRHAIQMSLEAERHTDDAPAL